MSHPRCPYTFDIVIRIGYQAKEKRHKMKSLRLPRTDKERMQLLNTIYVKGMSTPKEELAFSHNLLVYLKPFIIKMQTAVSVEDSGTLNLGLVRQVVDDLIRDIYEEIEASCLRVGGRKAEYVAKEYGLNTMFNPFNTNFYTGQKVA